MNSAPLHRVPQQTSDKWSGPMESSIFNTNLVFSELNCVTLFLVNRSMEKLKKKQNKTKIKTKVHYSPWFCNSTQTEHTLQMLSDLCGPRQTILWDSINQWLLQTQVELYPIQTILNHCSQGQFSEVSYKFPHPDFSN